MSSSPYSDNETDGAAIRKYAFILVAVCLVTGSYAFWKSQSKDSQPGVAAAQSGNSKSKTRKPDSMTSSMTIVVPESGVTTDSVRHEVKEWLDKTLQSGGLTPEPAHIPKDRWVSFAKAAIAMEVGLPKAPPVQQIIDMARDLVPVAHEHPVSAFLVGMMTLRSGESGELLQKAYQGLSAQPGMETLAFHAAVGYALSTPEGTGAEKTQERVKQALDALRKALDAEAGYSKHSDRVCAYILMSGHIKSFFDVVHEEYWQEISKTESVKPWVKKWVEGLSCLQKAWDARGGGYSNSVSDDGFAVFGHESEKSRRLLAQAWELNPQAPDPAVALIYSCLSMGKEKAPSEMRRWFDEVLKLQVDVDEAGQHMLWGLRRRWFGSQKKMDEFGIACLNTERFDSGLPWIFLQAHRDIASEWDIPDDYFRELHRCFEGMQALFDGAENEPKRAPWRTRDRTHAAIASFKCGHYAEAQKWLEKLEFKPHPDVIASWGIDEALLLGKTAAFAGESGAKLREAEVSANQFNAKYALERYEEAIKSSTTKLSAAGLDYLEKQIAILKIEAGLDAGDKVPLMQAGNFHAWSHEGAGWKLKDGSLEHFGREMSRVTTCHARVGSSFTVEGEIEITDADGDTQVWISSGYPENRNKECWVALRFVRHEGKTYALLSNGMNRPLEHPELAVESRFKFKYVGSTSGMSLYVNDKPIFEGVPTPEDFVKERNSQIGIGAGTKSEKTRIKIHALSVTR